MAPLPDPIGNEITEMTDLFERTKNTAAAWRAYSLAQTYTRPVPPVIQAEVNRFAACVGEAVRNAVQNEVQLLAATSLRKKENEDDQEKMRTLSHKDRLINFRAAELYAAWRGSDGPDNPVGEIQKKWRQHRIFEALRTLVERGVRPGRAREVVFESGFAGADLDAIERIWKQLKTKRHKKTDHPLR